MLTLTDSQLKVFQSFILNLWMKLSSISTHRESKLVSLVPCSSSDRGFHHTRNRHHALLEQIPKVGRTTGKKIHEHYADLGDFSARFAEEPPSGIKIGGAAHAAAPQLQQSLGIPPAKPLLGGLNRISHH